MTPLSRASGNKQRVRSRGARTYASARWRARAARGRATSIESGSNMDGGGLAEASVAERPGAREGGLMAAVREQAKAYDRAGPGTRLSLGQVRVKVEAS